MYSSVIDLWPLHMIKQSRFEMIVEIDEKCRNNKFRKNWSSTQPWKNTSFKNYTANLRLLYTKRPNNIWMSFVYMEKINNFTRVYYTKTVLKYTTIHFLLLEIYNCRNNLLYKHLLLLFLRHTIVLFGLYIL